LLEPMTKEETETEAKGWYALLRAKEREITVAELDVSCPRFLWTAICQRGDRGDEGHETRNRRH